MKKSSLHDRIEEIVYDNEKSLSDGYYFYGNNKDESNVDTFVSQLEELFSQTLKEVVGKMEKERNEAKGFWKLDVAMRNQLRSEILKRWEEMK